MAGRGSHTAKGRARDSVGEKTEALMGWKGGGRMAPCTTPMPEGAEGPSSIYSPVGVVRVSQLATSQLGTQLSTPLCLQGHPSLQTGGGGELGGQHSQPGGSGSPPLGPWDINSTGL